jgi:hypothetical protein
VNHDQLSDDQLNDEELSGDRLSGDRPSDSRVVGDPAAIDAISASADTSTGPVDALDAGTDQVVPDRVSGPAPVDRDRGPSREVGRAVATGEAGSTTGDARVDAALLRLRELDGRSSGEAAEVYDDIHRVLVDALAEAASPTTATAPIATGPGER